MVIDNEDVGFITSFLNGDEECFNRIVRKYQQKVYYLALRIMSNHHDAEDVSQEAFVRVYRSLKHLKERQYFWTWLYRITLNLCFTKIKKKRYDESINLTREISDTKATCYVEDIEKQEIKQEIKKVLNTLPKQQKAVFILRIYDDLKFEEIAEIMGLSIGGAKSNFFNAVEKIKERVKRWL
ncbi:MAG: sigma-70 family RNA polymerase sigma factor [Candidatus Firestonebacteria bacterium]